MNEPLPSRSLRGGRAPAQVPQQPVEPPVPAAVLSPEGAVTTNAMLIAIHTAQARMDMAAHDSLEVADGGVDTTKLGLLCAMLSTCMDFALCHGKEQLLGSLNEITDAYLEYVETN